MKRLTPQNLTLVFVGSIPTSLAKIKYKGGCIWLDYIIKNNKQVYIRLSNNGKAETCNETNMGRFTEQKAKNILKALPKTLKNLNFYVECIPDIKVETPVQKIVREESKHVIENTDYHPSDNVTQWIEKFGTCYDIFKEARDRYEYLEKELRMSDSSLMDILHSIELETSKDLYSAWLLYKKIRENRRNRRQLKDEMMIIHNILREIDETKINRERTEKAIEGLFDRKYRYRIVEENEDDNM